MKLSFVLAITVTVALIALFEWRQINQKLKREKIAFVTLTAVGWLLAILLVLYPDMPGPTQFVEAIFKPLGKLLER